MNNYVMEGKYKNLKIDFGNSIWIKDNPYSRIMNKLSISTYTVIDETNKDQYSFWKGALGVALFGGFGAIAGVGGKKSKEYLVAVEWKDGEKSLLSLDEDAYKVFVKSMFQVKDLSEDRSFVYIDANFCTYFCHSFTVPRNMVRYLNFRGLSVPPSLCHMLLSFAKMNNFEV